MMNPADCAPSDALFDGLFRSLDPHTVLDACCDQLVDVADDERARWKHARMIEALYHPGRYVRVAYSFDDDEAVPPNRPWPQGQVIYLNAPVREPVSRRGTVIHVGGTAVEAYRFPNDRRLRGLRKFTSREGAMGVLQSWIDASGDAFTPDSETLQRVLIRYVPEQKWIARLRVRGTDGTATGAGSRQATRRVAVRCCARVDCETLTRRHRWLSSITAETAAPFIVPGVVGADSELGLLATQWLRGDSLLDVLLRESPGPILARVAEVLSAVHALPQESLPEGGLPLHRPADLRDRLAAIAADLAAACPELADDLAAIESASVLSETTAEWDVAVLHNDFHWNQLRFRKNQVGLLDFERMCLGDPLADVANFAAQIRMLGERPELDVSPAEAVHWAELFLDEWIHRSGRPIHSGRFSVWTVLSLLELARGMMRHLRPGWRELARRCVDRAAEVLDSRSQAVSS